MRSDVRRGDRIFGVFRLATCVCRRGTNENLFNSNADRLIYSLFCAQKIQMQIKNFKYHIVFIHIGIVVGNIYALYIPPLVATEL